MKQIILLLILLQTIAFNSFSQGRKQIKVDSKEYATAKANGTLDQFDITLDLRDQVRSGSATPVLPSRDDDYEAKTSACDCYRAPDASYLLALPANDDGSSSLIQLPFTFTFYGASYTSLYINNNGNVTFGSPLSAFSSNVFPSSGAKIIAPFWADVDTRGAGRVVYKITPTAIFINWENVGYYNSQTDKKNTFQLILSNGADPAVVDDNNVAFCYKNMEWTTGSASGGTNGFGGTPATAGSNKGDNLSFFQIGRFDHPGTDFDGPLGQNDGIGYLTNKSFFFNITGINNIPPIPQGVSQCDTFKICALSDTADFNIMFLSPELNQTTSITWTNGGLNELTEVLNTSGNTAQLILRGIGTTANVGTYDIEVTATDSYITPGVTTLKFTIIIEASSTALNPIINSTVTCGNAVLSVGNGPYDNYLWSNGAMSPTLSLTATDEDFAVTVSRDKCYKLISKPIRIPQHVVPNFQGGNALCPGEDSSRFVMTNFDQVGTINWGAGNTFYNNQGVVWLRPGTHQIQVADTSGLCVRTTPLVITQGVASIVPPAFSAPIVVCGTLHYQVSNATAGTDAVWSSPNPEIRFNGNATSTVNNPLITSTLPGTYTVFLTSPCREPFEAKLIFSRAPVIDFPSDTICGREFQVPEGTVRTIDGGNWLNLDPQSVRFDPNTQSLNPKITIADNVTLPYELSLRIYDKYCVDLFDQKTILFVPPGTANIPPVGCDLNEWDLIATSFAAGKWSILNYPNSHLVPDSVYKFEFSDSVEIPHLIVKYPGVYKVSYHDEFCDVTTEKDIYFPPYIWTEVRDTMICEGLEFELNSTVAPNAVVSYMWNTGATTPSILVGEPGTYIVQVKNECYTYEDTAYVNYYKCDIDVPNVISLKSQSGNNVWFVNSSGIATFECFIMDRWGNVVQVLNNVNEYWNGRDRSGKVVSEGVYFYNIKATSVGGINLNKQGFITVVD